MEYENPGYLLTETDAFRRDKTEAPKFWQTAKGNLILSGLLGLTGSVLFFSSKTAVTDEGQPLNVFLLLLGFFAMGLFDGI